jgi:hypothetical protein
MICKSQKCRVVLYSTGDAQLQLQSVLSIPHHILYYSNHSWRAGSVLWYAHAVFLRRSYHHSHLHSLLESLTSILAATRIGFPPKTYSYFYAKIRNKPRRQSLPLSLQDFTKKKFSLCLIEVPPLESILAVVILFLSILK